MLRPALALVALLSLLSGCSVFSRKVEDVGPTYTPKNVSGPASWPIGLQRVALLPAHDVSGDLPPENLSAYDPIWQRSLSSAQRAELVPVARSQMAVWIGKESVASTGLLPYTLLERITRETGAQAVLFLDLTSVKSYPPLSLGFRARLAALPSGETIWVADELFDGADDATARSARRFARDNNSAPGDAAAGVAQSPTRFGAYAFHAVAALLPPRIAPSTNVPKPQTTR